MVRSVKAKKNVKGEKVEKENVSGKQMMLPLEVEEAAPVEPAQPARKTRKKAAKVEKKPKETTAKKKTDETAKVEETPVEEGEPEVETVREPAEPASGGEKQNVAQPQVEQTASGNSEDEVQSEYFRLKKKLMELEKKNYTKIYFLWQRSYWFRAFGHSALIYHYDVAKQLQRSSQIYPDRDFGDRFPEGLVNIRDMNKLHDQLVEHGFNLIGQNMYFRVYNAGKRYTDTELKFFQEAQDKELASVNKVVVPVDVFPHLSQLLRQIGRMVFHRVAKMDRNAREMVGLEMAIRMDEILVQYSLMTKGNQGVEAMTPEGFLDYVKQSMAWLQAKMGVMMDFLVLEPVEVQKVLILTGKALREVEACRAERENR